MSELENPFFYQETTDAYELPTAAIFSAGDAATIQASLDLSRWLSEAGFVGSDETVERAASVFAHFEKARGAYADFMGIATQEMIDQPEPVSHRELVIGTAAIYGRLTPAFAEREQAEQGY